MKKDNHRQPVRNYDFINGEHNCCQDGREFGMCEHITSQLYDLNRVRELMAEVRRLRTEVDRLTNSLVRVVRGKEREKRKK